MFQTKKRSIVVPWDFSDNSEMALQHAYQLAQVVGDNILLVALVRKPGLFASKAKYNQQMEQVQDRIDKVVVEMQEKMQKLQSTEPDVLSVDFGQNRPLYPVTMKGMAIGYKSIRAVFKNLFLHGSSTLVVMTQNLDTLEGGSLDMVHELGSLRVSVKDTLPLIVVNQPPKHRYYTDIVVPVSYENSYKETVSWIAYLAQYYHCNVNMIKPAIDDTLKKQKLANNLKFTKDILTDHGVVYGVKTAGRQGEFPEEVDKFTKQIDADMLIIMTPRRRYFFPNNQVVAGCPVMLVNPLLKRYQSFN